MPQDNTKPENGKTTSADSIVRSCSCTNGFQDSWYGKGKRLHNKGKTHDTCTACGAVKPK